MAALDRESARDGLGCGVLSLDRFHQLCRVVSPWTLQGRVSVDMYNKQFSTTIFTINVPISNEETEPRLSCCCRIVRSVVKREAEKLLMKAPGVQVWGNRNSAS